VFPALASDFDEETAVACRTRETRFGGERQIEQLDSFGEGSSGVGLMGKDPGENEDHFVYGFESGVRQRQVRNSYRVKRSGEYAEPGGMNRGAAENLHLRNM
jgi:hypothetical protein